MENIIASIANQENIIILGIAIILGVMGVSIIKLGFFLFGVKEPEETEPEKTVHKEDESCSFIEQCEFERVSSVKSLICQVSSTIDEIEDALFTVEFENTAKGYARFVRASWPLINNRDEMIKAKSKLENEL